MNVFKLTNVFHTRRRGDRRNRYQSENDRHRILCGGRSSTSREDGFTLVEILVVITIIGLIMGLVGPRVLNYLSESKVKAATIQIQSFTSALDLFYLDLGRYPSTSEGLAALIQRPAGSSSWNGPYLKSSAVPNDPWGHPYKYRSPSEHGPFEIISLGSDGKEGGTGTAANIKSWEMR
jgi:general secretion pathway protein G